MEWVEVKGPTVELAVQAAVEELGLTSADQVRVEVLKEPEKGFLGVGRKDAVVRVQPKAKRRRRPKKKSQPESGSPAPRQKKRQEQNKPRQEQKREQKREQEPQKSREEDSAVLEEQAEIIGAFLRGLLEAFGLEGTVETRVEEEIIYADVLGGQTEALIGKHGVVLESILELCKTVIQRRTRESARIRLDIGGYRERRREALRIYAQRLTEQVLEEQTEIMLEPMNAADRKVIHDAVAEVEGVRTYSEGEEPRRSVVLSPED
ncbi:MAG: RNA-binding cell elongation regulator Jag/EloR [Acidimicrobiia bacterium]